MSQRIPSLKTTLSHAAPDKAAEIRSVITGALKYSQNGCFSFEHSVETTFVLPWDLNPRVEPQRLSREVRDLSRSELLDEHALSELESSGAINWNNSVQWEYRSSQGGSWTAVDSRTAGELEIGYHTAHSEWQFALFPQQFRVDFSTSKMLRVGTREVFDLRRLAFAVLMPMKTEADSCSLFHAASLGFWGIHDRTLLLSQAVIHTLSDAKAQFMLYDRWCNWITRLLPQGSKPGLPQWDAAKKNIDGGPQLHLFTLSNVAQRPIVVYSHPESAMGGIYLPLLWESDSGMFPCDSHPHLRNPLILGYDVSRNHFVPLVTFKGPKGPNPILLPLTTASGTPLPVHFLNEAQAKDPNAILSRMMYVDYIPVTFGPAQLHRDKAMQVPTSSSTSSILTCVMNISELPEVIDELIKRYQSRFL